MEIELFPGDFKANFIALPGGGEVACSLEYVAEVSEVVEVHVEGINV